MLFCLNNTRFDDYLHLVYPNELEVKDTTDNQNLLLTWPSPWNRKRQKTKTEPTINMMLHFFISQFPFYQQHFGFFLHRGMEFTFHIPYVILGFVPSTVIFSTELLKQGYVEVIATKYIWSSSQYGWPLRNIHISNDNGSFTSFVDVLFPLSLPRL